MKLDADRVFLPDDIALARLISSCRLCLDTPMSDSRRNANAASRRGTFPGRVYRLGAEPADDLHLVTTPEERLEILVDLTRRSWMLTGRAIPVYERHAMPVAIRRLR